MQHSATFWDKTAEKYAKSPIGDLEAYNYTLERTRSYLSSTDKILEVGCGTGSTALLLAAGVDQIVATDVSGNMIEIAEEKARDQSVSNVSFITADVFDSAIDNGPYDAVLALNFLHLLEDTSAAVQHINGLLKPGGLFISKTVCQPGQGSPLKFRLLKAVLPVMQFLGQAPYVKFMKIQELEDIVTSEGFKIVESGNYPPPSRYVVAQKV